LDKAEKSGPQLLLLCQLFYPELISTGQTLTELCEELTAEGMQIEVVCGPPTIVDRDSNIPRHINHKGIRITRVWGTHFPKLNLLGRIINQITFAVSVFFYLLFDRSKRIVMVLTNPPFLAVSCAILRFFRIGNPYIYLIFDVYPDTAIHLGLLKAKGLTGRIWEWTNAFVFNYSTAIIVIGRCMRDVIVAKMKSHNLVAKNKIHTIHIWSDDKLIHSVAGKANPFVEKWGLEGKFVVGYFGNMGWFHDLETIMETAKILKEQADIVFQFVGEGRKKQYAMDFADKWNLSNCRFHTYVDREYLSYSLSTANISLVSLSEGQQGLSVPSKTFASMAAGVPVIAIMSHVSEIARIIIENDCGLVVEPGNAGKLANAVLDFYNNRGKSEQMGANARRAIDTKYNLRSAASAYYELICNVNQIQGDLLRSRRQNWRTSLGFADDNK